MTTTTTTPDARPLPLGVRRIEPGNVACRACGTPCGPDAPRETLAVVGREIPNRGMVEARSEVTFGLCPTCAALDAHAARALDAHPAIRRAIGSASIGRHRIVSAFHALAVVGAKPAETYTDDGLASLLDRLTVPGAAAPWSVRFSPIWQDDAARDTAASEPWLHVGAALRAEIRRQYGDHLADRMPPRPVVCPTRGCAWCGIGSVIAKRTAEPWTAHSMASASLGGAPSPRALAVHLCPTCERYRSNGESMRAALLDVADPAREIRRRRPYEPELRGVRGWAVANRTRPNAAPWAHVGLDALRALLDSGDY